LIITRAEAELYCSELHTSGRKVVFTNGCFDILHPGHVHILRAARALGDVLIVGVNTDDSVRRLKGSSRPVNCLSSRLVLLSEMRSVDLVVPFKEDTPRQLIEEVRPDVLVKGGDYTVDSVVGAEFVISCGGRVEIVPLFNEFSTSSIIRILEKENDIEP
jgi:rfaE bifunctional protein nucleotidyltransferase chain/domain